MAEIEFSKHVPAPAEGQPLPNAYHRNVNPEVTHFPDLQSAISQYGNASNWMSAMGSEVAARASNAIASRIGTEMGKNPRGDIGLPFTDFDKVMHESYNAQTQATLGIQANKLITDTNLEIARAPRVTPEMIAKSQSSITIGLQNIFKNAPAEVRSKLEYQYANQLINQGAQLTERMISEQRQDQKNNIDLSNRNAAEQAYSLALSGDEKAAQAVVENTRRINNAGVNARVATPESGKVATDTARLAYEKGKITRAYEEARKNNQDEKFLKDLADKKPSYLSDNDYLPVTNHLISYVGHQQSLRSQQENYQVQQMENRIATNPTNITDGDWINFAEQVGKVKAEQTRFKLIQAFKSKQNDDTATNELISNYGSPTAQANAEPKVQNKAFNQNVATTMQNNPGMSRDQAEVQVAASAGATVPVFTKTIKNKLWSGDPAQMDSGVNQIHDLQTMKAGHALAGLSDADLALYSLYEANRNPSDPTQAAKMVIDNSQNLDPPVLKITQQKWANLVNESTYKAGKDVDDWVLSKFGFYKEDKFFSFGRKVFDSPFMATTYAGDIFGKYKSFYEASRGNNDVATKLTQEYVDANYGKTFVNGVSGQWTLHPIEKTMGFAEGEGIPSIHADLTRQFQEPLAKLKQAYDNHASDEYWEIKAPTVKGERLRFIKHERAQVGTTVKEYPVSLIGTNFDQWDVAIDTANGPRNIFLEAPKLGIMTYKPDRAWIMDEYKGRSHIFPRERYAEIIKNMTKPKDINNG